MSYRAESFWFGQPMHEACLAKPRRSWCLNKFLFDLILKSAVFFTLEQHLTEDVSHQKSGLAWAVVFSGSLGWAGLWLCFSFPPHHCCLWNNHLLRFNSLYIEQHSLHDNSFLQPLTDLLTSDNSAITRTETLTGDKMHMAASCWPDWVCHQLKSRGRARDRECRRCPNVVTNNFNFNLTLFGL